MTRAEQVRTRYSLVKRHGGSTRVAARVRHSAKMLREWLSGIGVDPVQFGEVAMAVGGKPRSSAPEAESRRARYRELRDLGASALEASSVYTAPNAARLLAARLQKLGSR